MCYAHPAVRKARSVIPMARHMPVQRPVYPVTRIFTIASSIRHIGLTRDRLQRSRSAAVLSPAGIDFPIGHPCPLSWNARIAVFMKRLTGTGGHTEPTLLGWSSVRGGRAKAICIGGESNCSNCLLAILHRRTAGATVPDIPRIRPSSTEGYLRVVWNVIQRTPGPSSAVTRNTGTFLTNAN